MANEQTLKGQWKQLKGKVKGRWGFLTDDDLTRAEGNTEELIGIIQSKTGESREKVEHDLEQLSAGLGAAVDQFKDKAKEKVSAVKEKASGVAADASERAKDYARQATQYAQDQYGNLQDQLGSQYGQLASNVQAGYETAEHKVRTNPLESVAVALGTGIIAGVILGLCFRPRY